MTLDETLLVFTMSLDHVKVLSMKKLIGALLAVALTFSSISVAEASKRVPYKNQKAGQFCKTVDIGKRVVIPDGTNLRCKKDGSRARWTR